MPKLTQYIWFEKWRPSKLKEVSLNKEHRVAFKKYIKDGQIPHLILEGPAGSGKSTMAYILTNEVPCVTLMLNASGKEDRSIETMQTKVKQFAASKPPDGKIKIVVLEEASGMLPQAQEALKDTIEKYSEKCRFLLTCNHYDKIVQPIQSRCIRFTFDKFPKRKLLSVCKNIIEQENIEGVSVEDLNELINRFYPDMRSIVNNLQAACVGGSFNAKAIGALQADPKEIMENVLSGSLLSLRQKIAGTTNFTFMYKYLFNEFLPEHGDNEQKADIALAIAEALSNENTIPDREINFVACCINIMTILDITTDFSK